jgi:hypothetical protein
MSFTSLPSIWSARRRSGNYFNWAQRTSSFGTTNIRGIAYGSDGYWVQ